ncbi:hypothetical protein Tco_1037676 [Tanacetum coccineum]
MHLLDSKETGADHLPKIKTRLDWLKPILEEETLETPKPDWVVPPNDLPEPENNWADAIAKSYQDPEENKLLQKTRDMGSFIKWYCKWIGKSKLTKANLEGPTFKLVRPFHKNNISLQFQMEECHQLLTNKIYLTNIEGNWVVPDVSKPLPLGGPPGQVTIQPQYFFNKDLEYLIIGNLNHLSGANKVLLFNALNLWIRNLVIRKRIKDLQLGIKSYQTKLNLTQANRDASDFLFKEDYTIVHKPRAVIYRDRNDQKKMMWENEVHKFIDDTLTRILEKLDHTIEGFRLFKFNPGMKNRIWSEYDKRRLC